MLRLTFLAFLATLASPLALLAQTSPAEETQLGEKPSDAPRPDEDSREIQPGEAARPRGESVLLDPYPMPEATPRISDRCCAVTLRAGPYTPEQINPDSAGPQFGDVYGDSAQAMFGLDFEWQPLRFKYVGTLGLGGGAGFYRKRGQALRPDGTQAPEQATFVIAPGSADITYRMALFTDQPIVPYAGAGLDAWYFSESKEGGAGSVSGAKYGWHWRAGGMLLLDLLDPRSAGAMDVNWGINNTYLFGEYRGINMGNFGKNTGFDLSDRTWFAGLMFEF